MDKFAIIGGDIHKLILKSEFNPEYGWSVDEDEGHVWIPVPNEKRQTDKGTWMFVDYGAIECLSCMKRWYSKAAHLHG